MFGPNLEFCTLVLATTGLAFSLLLGYVVGNCGPLFAFFTLQFSTHIMALYISISFALFQLLV